MLPALYVLNNGLRLVVQQRKESTMAYVNLMYRVGSRNESATRTGLAHFLEHIMFGGSQHVPSYDQALQCVGGTNNAYTSSDVTNYWCKLPATKLEVALWLESDRLLAPSYKEENIAVQRNVVIEEFKQTCFNRPYGDVHHLLLEQAYEIHPYSWPTIGKKIDHLKEVTREELIDFGSRFYCPNNLVLVIVSPLNPEFVYEMTQKWFDEIPSQSHPESYCPQEPSQTEAISKRAKGKVPQNALYRSYHLPSRTNKDYQAIRLLRNFLGEGRSSSLHNELIEDQKLFSDIGVYITETFDPGLFIIEGRLQENVAFEEADYALEMVIDQVVQQKMSNNDLAKAKNQEEADHLLSLVDPLEHAENLAYAVFLGSLDFFDKEIDALKKLKSEEVQTVANRIFQKKNSHVLYYEKQ